MNGESCTEKQKVTWKGKGEHVCVGTLEEGTEHLSEGSEVCGTALCSEINMPYTKHLASTYHMQVCGIGLFFYSVY